MAPAVPTCPRCGAPRLLTPDCPRCGVIYARAEALAARRAAGEAGGPARPAAPSAAERGAWDAEVASPPAEAPLALGPAPLPRAAHLPPETPSWDARGEAAHEELRVRQLALPVALGVAALVVSLPFGRALSRIFLSMWVHELGHAVTAWLCGVWALPGPWVTRIGQERAWGVAVVVAAAVAALGVRGWRARRRGLEAWAWGTGVLLLAGLLLPLRTAQALITFGGDAGCLVLGSVLMATVYAHPESRLRKGWLRFGLLAIGAFAFADAAHTWWGALRDVDAIPYGEIEGVGLSDPSKLTGVYRWTQRGMVRAYVGLSLVCLAALGALYAHGLRTARAEAGTTDFGD